MFAYCDVCWCWFVTLFIPNFCPAIHLVTHHRAKTHFSPIFFTVWHFFLKSKVVRMNIFAKKGGRNPHFRTLYYAIILCKRMILRILSSSVNSITVFTKKLLPSQKLYMVCAKKSLWSSWNIYLEKAPLWTPKCFKIAKGNIHNLVGNFDFSNFQTLWVLSSIILYSYFYRAGDCWTNLLTNSSICISEVG